MLLIFLFYLQYLSNKLYSIYFVSQLSPRVDENKPYALLGRLQHILIYVGPNNDSHFVFAFFLDQRERKSMERGWGGDAFE